MVGIIRREMEAAGFLDIQTPILFKPTPEGARDFVVPSRLQKGRFYALPQSPQILKQLTMVAGFDRYYQIAICFRDEDLRADRVQEITQLDVEMSFPDQELLYDVMERMYARIWSECLGIEIATPFPRMTFEEADRRFGSDKPDTRFGLEVEDATELTRGSEFGVFAGAEAVRFLRVPQELSRGDLAKLEEIAKEWGAKGLAYLVFDEEGEVRSPIAKFLSEQELAAFRSEPASTVLFAADTWEATSRVLGALRLHLGRELGLIDEEMFTFLWVYDFPMFERDEDAGRWTAVHHPFTRPSKEWEGRFADDPGHALAHAYDLIVNGNELGGGSFRIHEPEIQAKVFELLGMSVEEQRSKFGFLLDALAMGAPPMGGIALGIDRMTMVLAGEPNLRDVIAFPKNQAGVDPMSGAPSEVTPEQLTELGIRLRDAPELTDVEPEAPEPAARPSRSRPSRSRPRENRSPSPSGPRSSEHRPGAAGDCVGRGRAPRGRRRTCAGPGALGRVAGRGTAGHGRRSKLVHRARRLARCAARRREDDLQARPHRPLARSQPSGASVRRQDLHLLRRRRGADRGDRQRHEALRPPVRADRVAGAAAGDRRDAADSLALRATG